MKLEVRNLQKSFGEKEVLKGISFSCESGESIALLGRNGAGKTTLFRCILNIFQEDSGEILIDGEKINRKKLTFGYLPEERGLYLDRTVHEQMMYFGRLRGLSKATCEKQIDDLLQRLDAFEYKNSKLDSLSKGNKQKIQLAIAVINNPDIVIFDEPFSGLDPVSSKLLKKLIEDFANDGKIVIFSSHEMGYTEEFCEKIAILHNGAINTFGNLKEIKASYPRTKIKVLLNDKNNYQIIKNSAEYNELSRNIDFDNDYIYFELRDENYVGLLQTMLVESKFLVDEFVVVRPSLEEIFVEKVGV